MLWDWKEICFARWKMGLVDLYHTLCERKRGPGDIAEYREQVTCPECRARYTPGMALSGGISEAEVGGNMNKDVIQGPYLNRLDFALDKVEDERRRQNRKYGEEHDKHHSDQEWLAILMKEAAECCHRCNGSINARRRWISRGYSSSCRRLLHGPSRMYRLERSPKNECTCWKCRDHADSNCACPTPATAQDARTLLRMWRVRSW